MEYEERKLIQQYKVKPRIPVDSFLFIERAICRDVQSWHDNSAPLKHVIIHSLDLEYLLNKFAHNSIRLHTFPSLTSICKTHPSKTFTIHSKC